MKLDPRQRSEVLALDVPVRLGWLDRDGFPRITPLWFLYEDGTFYMTSVRDKRHVAGLRRDPRAFACVDTEERVSVGGVRRNRQVKGRGRAELFDDEGGRWTRRITLKYVHGEEGEERAAYRASMPRVVIRLRPERLIAIGTPDPGR